MAPSSATGAQGVHAAHGAGAAAGGIPLLTGGLLLYYAVYVLRSGARLVPAGPHARVGRPTGGVRSGWATRPELTLACRLSMGLATLAMLCTL
ncbi:DUF5134 domain-containing protein, partial [Streptomyces sp. NPDC051771]|uniref:DUF5134 domain-containing protein n=1 Tax=Streptomyces sp. NPDC051771 TaxID=3154847 RepID=UPI0034353975